MENQYSSERIKQFAEAKNKRIGRNVALYAAVDIIASIYRGMGRIVNIQELQKEAIELAQAFEEYLGK
jgi:hypothetical protein